GAYVSVAHPGWYGLLPGDVLMMPTGHAVEASKPNSGRNPTYPSCSNFPNHLSQYSFSSQRFNLIGPPAVSPKSMQRPDAHSRQPPPVRPDDAKTSDFCAGSFGL